MPLTIFSRDCCYTNILERLKRLHYLQLSLFCLCLILESSSWLEHSGCAVGRTEGTISRKVEKKFEQNRVSKIVSRFLVGPAHVVNHRRFTRTFEDLQPGSSEKSNRTRKISSFLDQALSATCWKFGEHQCICLWLATKTQGDLQTGAWRNRSEQEIYRAFQTKCFLLLGDKFEYIWVVRTTTPLTGLKRGAS